MGIFKNFTSSVAGAALVATAVTTSVALPEVAEAQTIREPASCTRLDSERRRIENENRSITRRQGNDISSALRRGGKIDAGRILGSLAGGAAQREINNQYNNNSRYIRDLEDRCEADRELLQAGVCKNNTRERGSVDTANGRVVGSARGRIDEERNCSSQTYGSPGNRTLTGGSGAGGAIARERDLEDRGMVSRGGASSGRDFSKCAQITDHGKPALACPTSSGGVEIVPMAAPSPRR